LLLGNMALWETLASEDHAMLCALPAPHGPLFAWLESVFHEQGALGWSALQIEMQSQAFAEDAVRWMAQDSLGVTPGSEDATPPDPQEARQELRRLLTLLQVDRLKQLETEALAQASTGLDPEAQQRWRSLHERRKELMASAAAALLASQ
jgi:DNA primase